MSGIVSSTVRAVISAPYYALEFVWKTLIWISLFSPAKEQEYFELYLKLPPEIRMMIIDRMRTEDRCRFSRSSKQSNKEAKSSKHFIHSLQLIACEENNISIYVTHNKYTNDDDIDFIWKFEIANGQKWIRGIGPRNGEVSDKELEDYLEHGLVPKDEDLFVEKLDNSTDLVEYAVGYFKKLLKEHQNKINHLNFFGDLFDTKLKNYDFGIENLASLEQLDIHGQLDVPFYLSKTRRPLNRLCIKGDVESDITTCKQIYQVRNSLDLNNIKLTYEQFLQLSASEVSIHIGELTEIDIFNFIKSWQNGEFEKDIELCEWTKLEEEESNFDVFELLKLLNHIPVYKAKRGVFEIENNTNAGIYGELRWYHKRSLSFEIFKNYLDLLPELRMMIIDEMEIKDRCRFTGCSKLCRKEAKSSKNYIYSLDFDAVLEDNLFINISHNKCDHAEESDYTLNFTKKDDKKFIKLSVTLWKEYRPGHKEYPKIEYLWVEELDRSTELVEYAAEYFKKLLEMHQKQIKRLGLYGNLLSSELFNFEVESLNRLKELIITTHLDVVLYLSNIRYPLEKLYIYGDVGNDVLTEFQQIYEVRDDLYMPATKFTYEQFLRLSASIVDIHIGYLTERDIANFIRSWQNGTIGKRIIDFGWNLKDSSFDMVELFRLLELEFDQNDI